MEYTNSDHSFVSPSVIEIYIIASTVSWSGLYFLVYNPSLSDENMDTGDLFSQVKTKKICGETSADDNVDRLSDLTEDLINRIMSFLPMEDAVRTDTLSKKWRYRWTDMTSFQFHDYYVHSRKPSKKEHFMLFLERALLLLGRQAIKSFSLECLKQYDAARIHTWIMALVRREVQKLRIFCSVKGVLVLPQCALESKFLDEIHLTLPCTLKVSSSVCFSRLKILNLNQITFVHTGFPQSRELNISFPVLQELSLWGCSWENVLVITIDAPVLHSFNIGDLENRFVPKDSRVIDCVLKIQGSKLTKFICGSHTFVNISFVYPSTVSDATIELSSHYLRREKKMTYLTCALLRQFSSLESLTLSCETITAFAHLGDLEVDLPQLDGTLHLAIRGGTPLISTSFITLLLHLPCLESLTVYKGNLSSEADVVSEFRMESPLPALKVVKFTSISGRKDELVLAKFILKNAKNLQEITFIARGLRRDNERNIRVAKEELLGFPRASAQASIKFQVG